MIAKDVDLLKSAILASQQCISALSID